MNALPCYLQVPFFALVLTSAFNLVAITIERYMKIVHPIAHRVKFTRQTAYITIALVWILGIGYYLLVNLTTSAVIDGQCMMQTLWPNTKLDQLENVIHFTLHYLGPISVFVYCYSKMALALYKGSFKKQPVAAEAGVEQGPSTEGQVKEMSASTKRALHNIVKTMIYVSVAFFVCFSLNQWLFFVCSSINQWLFFTCLYIMNQWLFFTCSSINPRRFFARSYTNQWLFFTCLSINQWMFFACSSSRIHTRTSGCSSCTASTCLTTQSSRTRSTTSVSLPCTSTVASIPPSTRQAINSSRQPCVSCSV